MYVTRYQGDGIYVVNKLPWRRYVCCVKVTMDTGYVRCKTRYQGNHGADHVDDEPEEVSRSADGQTN